MSKNKENEELLLKIITLGDSKVGKTSIFRRFAYNTFDEDILSTIGIEFSFKNVTLKGGEKIKLKLIDTAGQEKFKSLAKSYYKNAEGVIFVFSYDDKDSFDHIEMWLNSFQENCNTKDIPMFLVGNKCDSENKAIQDNLIEELKNKIGFKYYLKTSAKENIGIEELFNELSEKMYQQNKKYIGKKQNNKQLANNKNDDENEKNKKKKLDNCCLSP